MSVFTVDKRSSTQRPGIGSLDGLSEMEPFGASLFFEAPIAMGASLQTPFEVVVFDNVGLELSLESSNGSICSSISELHRTYSLAR